MPTSSIKKTSIWHDSSHKPQSFPPLKENITTDIAIVGGGIHGIVAAYLLAKAGKQVTLVEQDKLCSGDTGYTTAFISYVIDESLSDLVKTFGKEKAQEAWQACQYTISQLTKIIQKENIDCDFEETSLTLYATTEDEKEYLKQESKLAQELGFKTSFNVDNKLPLKNQGYVAFPHNAKFHPLKFLSGLIKKASDIGVTFYEQTAVQNIDHGEKITLHTDKATITANYLIAATGAPINSPMLLQAKIKPTNTYVIAGTLPKKTLNSGLYIDVQTPYHYLRIDNDKDEDTFILGGEDHPTGEKKNTDEVYDRLEEYLKTSLTSNFTVTHHWGGQILTSLDGLPYIGHHPLYHNEMVGMCFSGDGMPFGILAAIINTDLILGKENVYTKLFAPGRFSGFVEFIKHGIDISQSMVSGYLPAEKKEFSSLEPGDAAVIDYQGKKIAVRRNKEGKILAISAVCTHMGCIVNWNKAQETWDCPCHGSRFTADGTVFRGPATKPLEEVQL